MSYCPKAPTGRHAARCDEKGKPVFADANHLLADCVHCAALLVRQHMYSAQWHLASEELVRRPLHRTGDA